MTLSRLSCGFPPCDPACSVAIGVATVEQQLTLVTRHRYGQFDADAAEEFTNFLIAQVTVPAPMRQS
jgi:hypothetical protein